MPMTDSDQYSLRSGALTRATSTDGYDSEQIITPVDEIPGRISTLYKSKTSNVHGGIHQVLDTARVYTESTHSPSRRISPTPNFHAEPDSYFPHYDQVIDNPPVRRRSTRELISRYEDRTYTSTSERCSSPLSHGREEPLPDIPPPLKGRAPLRESFRNLLSVFGKNRKAKAESAIPSTRYQTAEEMANEAGLAKPPINVDHRVSTPNALKSGPLLYLCASPSAGTLPVWNYCIAKLFPEQLLLEWSTSFGNPVTHSIPIAFCTDVHSLPASQVNQTERDLLPEHADTYIFKMTFRDNSSETFSAGSVSERSSWVSTIWDALLHCSRDLDKTRDSGKTVEANSNISEELRRKHGSQIRQSPNSTYTSPLTDSTRPLQQDSEKSPSVRYLSDKSVVRHRIAQINVNGFDTPLSRSTSTSARTRKYLAPPVLEHRGTAKRPASFQRTYTASATHSTETRDDFSAIETRKSKVPVLTPTFSERKDDEKTETLYRGSTSPSLSQHRPDWTPQPSQYAPTPAMTSELHMQSGENPVHPLVALIEDHSTRQYEKTAAVGLQIQALQDNLYGITQKIYVSVSKQDFATLKELIHGLRGRIELLNTMSERSVVDGKLSSVQANIGKRDQGESRFAKDFSKETLNSDTSDTKDLNFRISEKLEEILSIAKKHFSGKDITSSPSADLTFEHDAETRGKEVTDRKNPEKSSSLISQENEITEIFTLLRDDKEQRSAQAQQQADSVRYLHELNKWLESFVNNGNNQIQSNAATLQKVCSHLGLSDALNEAGSDKFENPSLMSTVKRLVEDSRAQDEHLKSLKEMLEQLLQSEKTTVSQDLPGKLDPSSVIDAVTNLMDSQRQEQERVLRNIAAGLSNDIKGERIRFVDAMKEATAINVQLHVEEFKKELSREVMGMTHEVGRLHKERQALQQQIGDLFSFLNKQREEMARSAAGLPALQPKDDRSPNRSNSRRRPLPTPALPGAFSQNSPAKSQHP